MITEDFVSFETAKLLKEKGFNEYCRYFFKKPDEGYLGKKNGLEFNQNSDHKNEQWFACPSLSLTMKWLREVHNIHIKVHCSGHRNYLVYAQSLVSAFCDFCIESTTCSFNSYEEAVKAAIKYCLTNLIK